MHFLSFYTDGSDGCYDLTTVSKHIESRLAPYFESVSLYNKDKLKSLPGSEDFCNSWPDPLPMNPNANKIGYFDFKGFLIKKKLEEIPEGSILMYHDGNFEKNAQYWESDWPNIENLCQNMLGANKSSVFCQFEREGAFVKEYVKSHIIDALIPDKIENEIIKNCYLINAARIILVNNEFSRKFIDDYIQICLDKTLIGPKPDNDPHPEFKWSCGDQDALNCLIYRYILDRKLEPTFPAFSFLYRVIRTDNKNFNWPGQSRNPHPTALSVMYNVELINYLR